MQLEIVTNPCKAAKAGGAPDGDPERKSRLSRVNSVACRSKAFMVAVGGVELSMYENSFWRGLKAQR